MLTYQELYQILPLHFLSHNNLERFNHSVRVVKMALKLNDLHHLNIDLEKVKVTAILHDYAKVLDDNYLRSLIINEYGPNSEELNYKPIWHALVGDSIVKEKFKITDLEILNAIKYHSTGRPNMTNLEKIIYLADYIEEGRTYKDASVIRKIAFQDLDLAIFKMTENSINYIKSKNNDVYHLTLDTYNYYKEK